MSLHCVRTYSEILLRDAICTHITHSILYSDFLNICIYIHIYNRTLTCIKTNKKCFNFLVTELQLSFWHYSNMIIMTNWKLGSLQLIPETNYNFLLCTTHVLHQLLAMPWPVN
jgi:hypothetical protein